jgi:uncharacterized membrane protein YidH (DUF202 family)
MTDRQLLDVGAQAERTALAWQRTGVGAMTAGALLLRWDFTDHLPSWPGIVLTVAGGATVMFFGSNRYRRTLRAMRSGHSPLSRGMVPAATLAMVLVILGVGAELAARLTA